MRFALKVISAGLFAIVLTGCGDVGTTTAPTSGNGSVGTTTNVVVAVTPTATQVVDAGQTVPLTATITGDSTNKGVTWTVTAGGGTLASTTGLTNIYTAPAGAVATAVVTATSVFDGTKSASANVTVNALPNFASTGQLVQGYVGVAYSATLAATGGTGLRTYAITAGKLPTGLTLNAATGTISGTPTVTGYLTFSVSVTDSAAQPITAIANFAIGVSSLQLLAPALTDTVVGQTYPAKMYTVAFAQGAVTYAVTAGSLPAGLTLSSGGVLSGSATTAGASNFTVTATDAAGQKASTDGSLRVVTPLTLAGATLPTTQAGNVFPGYVFKAAGGTAPYRYALTAGNVVPTGMGVTSTGVLIGTPRGPGTFRFSVVVTDSDGVASSTLQTATAQYSLTITVGPLAVTPTTLPNVVVGSPYSQPLTGTGGVGPYHYQVSSGALPVGITLTEGGLLAGRVTTSSPSSFTVQMTDSEDTPRQIFVNLTLNVSNTLTPGTKNSVLNGAYAFSFRGQNNGALARNATTVGVVYGADIAGALTFDGTSLITGTIDVNSASTGVQSAVAVTGSYSVGDDNRGKIVLQYSGKVLTLDIAASNLTVGVAGNFRFIEADSDNAIDVTQVQGSGEAVKQTPADFAMASLLGRYVFRMDGESPTPSSLAALDKTQPGVATQYGALSAAGYLSLTGAGLIVRGSLDAASYDQAYNQVSLTGSYTAPDTSGRGTMRITSVGNSFPAAPTNYVYYVISAKQIVLQSLDAHGNNSLMAGMAYQQQQSLYTAASLRGTVIAAESAARGGNGTSSYPGILSATFYVLRVTSPGNMAGYTIDNTRGVVATGEDSPDSLVYTVSDAGRVAIINTAAPSAQLPVFWLYDQNKAVGTESESTTGPIGTLSLEGQTAMTFDDASLNGSYATGTVPAPTTAAFGSGVLTADPTGTRTTQTQDLSSNGVLTSSSVTLLSKAIEEGSGRFTLSGVNIFYNGYILSPTKIIYFNAATGFTKPTIRIGEK